MVSNVVEDTKIFHLKPFSAPWDHFEAPNSQKAEVKGSQIAYSSFACVQFLSRPLMCTSIMML